MDIDIKPAEVFTITLTCKVNNIDKNLDSWRSLFKKDNEKFKNCISSQNQFEMEGKINKVNSKVFVNGMI